jgi:NAD(P)-dependent dehydrogenase (short-subunit alcohol dehydrogenase family)
MRLAQKVCVITGGGSGIGRATALLFAVEGARLVIADKLADRAQAVASACAGKGADAIAVAADVANSADAKRIVEVAVKRFGRLDVLVNNAGTTKHVPHDNLDGLSAEDFQRIYAVNTIGPFQMIRAARPLLEAAAKASSRSSSVVNVSSVAGIGGGGSSVAYAASKGALNTMTQSLARALAPLIRVNTVCPGYIDTPWFTKGRGEDGAKQVRDMVIARAPLKSASTAEDIAQLVCFLALPQSGQMTGEFVRMDAGMHLVQ